MSHMIRESMVRGAGRLLAVVAGAAALTLGAGCGPGEDARDPFPADGGADAGVPPDGGADAGTPPDGGEQTEELDPALEAVVFQRRLQPGEYALVLAHVDSGQERELVTGPVTGPALSPDGETLVYVRSDDWGVYALELDAGTPEAPLSAESGFMYSKPTFSPDGERVAYAKAPLGGTFDIWVVNRDGSEDTRLTFDEQQDVSPAFSPDGTRIVFSSNRDGQYELYAVRVDGTEPTRLTQTGDQDEFVPSFSPDGEWIAFSRRPTPFSAFADVFLIPDGGGEEQRLTTRPGADDFGPVFTRTGRLLFSSDEDEATPTFRIHLLEEDGASTQLTEGPRDQSPSTAYGRFF